MAKLENVELTFDEGDTEEFVFNWTNPDGTPVPNLDTARAYMSIAYSLADGAVLTREGSIDADTGQFEFLFTEEDTEALMGDTLLKRRAYIFDVQVDFADETDTPVSGKLFVKRDIHKIARKL